MVLPRALLDGVPDGWTCPQEPAEEVPCVTRRDRPEALVHRLPALPSSGASRGLAALLALVAVGASLVRPSGRLERFAAAVAGATVGFALALALVGASVAGWGASLACTVPGCAVLGMASARSPRGRVAGALSLATVPLGAVARVSAAWLCAVVAAVTAVALSGLGSAPRAAPEASPAAGQRRSTPPPSA